MGVRGLTKFLSEYENSLFKKVQLQNEKIVIDGFGLAYYLYFEIGRLDSSLGGEYEHFYNTAASFFKTLKACKITAFVILDGCIQKEKAKCIATRNQERINTMKKFFAIKLREKFRIIPHLAIWVLKQVMITHNIPYRVSTIDADSETVAWANHFSCRLLALDSDYFIFNVLGGYVPFTSLIWRQTSENQRNAISCMQYHTDEMKSVFGLKHCALPFLSVFIGNDWINMDDAATMFAKFAKKARQGTSKILQRINWLKGNFTNTPAFLKIVCNKVTNREFSLVQSCLQMYTDLPDISKSRFVIGKQVCSSKKSLQELIELDVAPPYMQDLFTLSRVYLPVSPFDIWERSPYVASENIRYLLYTVAVIKNESGDKNIKEFDAVNQEYVAGKLTITPYCEMCKSETVCKLVDSSRNNFKEIFEHVEPQLYEILELKNESLVVLSICLWKKRSKPIFSQIVAVVLLHFLSDEDEIMRKLRQDNISELFLKNRKDLDKNLLQKSAELQAIFLSLYELNTFCEGNIPMNSTLILRSNSDLHLIHEYIALKFSSSSYQNIADVLFGNKKLISEKFKRTMDIVAKTK